MLLTISCNKEEVQHKTVNDSELTNESYRVYDANEKEIPITSIDLSKSDQTLLIESFEENSNTYVCHLFKTTVELKNFESDSPEVIETKKRLSQTKQITELAYETGDYKIESEETEKYSSEITSLLRSIEQEINTGADRAPAILHDNINAGGSIRPITGSPTPSLGSFKDRAESLSGSPALVTILWPKTWFRGTAVSIFHNIVYTNFTGSISNNAESAF